MRPAGDGSLPEPRGPVVAPIGQGPAAVVALASPKNEPLPTRSKKHPPDRPGDGAAHGRRPCDSAAISSWA